MRGSLKESCFIHLIYFGIMYGLKRERISKGKHRVAAHSEGKY